MVLPRIILGIYVVITVLFLNKVCGMFVGFVGKGM